MPSDQSNFSQVGLAPPEPRLSHITDGLRMRRMKPHPSPPGTSLAGRELVWAVDRERLPHYLLPRDCPRVWRPRPRPARTIAVGACRPSRRVIAVEGAWLPALQDVGLLVHRLAPQPFRDLDAVASSTLAFSAIRMRNAGLGPGVSCAGWPAGA
jgi:hypothetical protein